MRSFGASLQSQKETDQFPYPELKEDGVRHSTQTQDRAFSSLPAPLLVKGHSSRISCPLSQDDHLEYGKKIRELPLKVSLCGEGKEIM